MRVGEDVRDAEHGAARHTARVETLQALGLREFAHPIRDLGVEGVLVLAPRLRRGEARVGAEVRPADRLAEPLEDAIRAGVHDDVTAVPRLELFGGYDTRHRVAVALAHQAAAGV